MKTMALVWWLEWCAAVMPGTVPTDLDSPRFKTREKAARQLEQGWPLTRPHLQAGIRKSQSLEIMVASSVILGRCVDRDIENPPWADWPLWDAKNGGWNGSACPPLSRSISRHLGSNYEIGWPWLNYREVSRKWGESAILEYGVPSSMVRLWFAIGRGVDAEYEKRRIPQVPID